MEVLLLLLLLACTSSGEAPPPAPQPPVTPPPPAAPCGPFAAWKLDTDISISVCVQSPVPTLILNVPGAPEAACQRIAAIGAKQSWILDDSSPAIGGTVGLALHRGQDRLNVGCTDVAGSTTATLSLTPALDAALP